MVAVTGMRTWTARRWAGPRGFTFIEIMVALAVLALSLTGLLGLRNRDLSAAALGHHLMEATLLANEKIAHVAAQGFPPVGLTEGDAESYHWMAGVSETPFGRVREVVVTVYWQEGGHREEVHLATYLFDGQ